MCTRDLAPPRFRPRSHSTHPPWPTRCVRGRMVCESRLAHDDRPDPARPHSTPRSIAEHRWALHTRFTNRAGCTYPLSRARRSTRLGCDMRDRHDCRTTELRDRGEGWDRSVGSRPAGKRELYERPLDVFTRNLDLPSGRDREEARNRERVYEINGAEGRMLAIIGAFRVVAESDLHDLRDGSSGRRSVRHLEREGLIHTSPLRTDDRAVTLTDRGLALLEANRYERHDRAPEPRQTFHAGIRKPRELTPRRRTTPRSIAPISAPRKVCGGKAAKCAVSLSTTSSSATINDSSTSAIAARRTATAGRTASPKRLPSGRVNTTCRTTMGTSGSRTRGSSTRTETAARGMRISKS